ncbi:MAG: hypothetical protein LBP75_00175 [Planctomycetota bacterium]|nr:hypothetical protein [Planctomycetota bacterium]
MSVINQPTAADWARYFDRLRARAGGAGKPWVKFLDLGARVIRLESYSPEFVPLIEKQLTYVLQATAPRWDATLVVWREPDFTGLAQILDPRCDPKKNLRLRVEFLVTKHQPRPAVQIFRSPREVNPAINLDGYAEVLTAFDAENAAHYYAVRDLDPEEFIKHGHIFVQALNKILKTPATNLVHGAAVGLNGKGILLCARGQRGKSTLAVTAMLAGMDYVSDDYLTLARDASGELFADPIYSIITLSPRMYNELYDTLDAKFVSNNARKDKYVLNIGAYHPQFKRHYPLRVGLFPQIAAVARPSIEPANKGRAIVQLVHSTINQMGDQRDTKTVKKLMTFVEKMDFYQINLSPDIWANQRCLREFAEKL